MNQIDQQRQRHSPHFQQTDLNSFRHDHQDMTRITRIIFNPFQYNKICMLLSFDILFPVTVSVIRIMIRDYHSLESLFLQNFNILFNPDSAVY